MILTINMANDYTSNIINVDNMRMIDKASFDIKWNTAAIAIDGSLTIYAVLDESGTLLSEIDALDVFTSSHDAFRWTEAPCLGYVFQYINNQIDVGTMTIAIQMSPVYQED